MTENESNDLTAFGKLLDALDPYFQAQELNNRDERLATISQALTCLEELDGPDGAWRIKGKIQNGIINFVHEFLSAAYEYHETMGTRSDLKAAKFLKRLGVSTCKNRKISGGGSLFAAFCLFVNPSPGFYPHDTYEALEGVAAMHGLASPETALQQIRAYIRAELKKAEQQGTAESFKKFIDSLNLPGNPPWSYK